jgi:hypothetical protein
MWQEVTALSEEIAQSEWQLLAGRLRSRGLNPGRSNTFVYFTELRRALGTPSIQWNTVFVGFEVLTAVLINIVIFWDIGPCSLYVNRRFGRKNSAQPPAAH